MSYRRESSWSPFLLSLLPSALVIVLSTIALSPRQEFLWGKVWLFQLSATLFLAAGLALVGWAISRLGRVVPGSRPSAGDAALCLTVGLLGAAGAWNLNIPIPFEGRLGFLLLIAAWILVYAVVRWLAGRRGAGAEELALPMAGLVLVPALLNAVLRAPGTSVTVRQGSEAVAVLLALAFLGLALRGGRRRGAASVALCLGAVALVRLAAVNPHDLHVRGQLAALPSDGPPVFLIVFDDCRADAVDLSDPATSNTPRLAAFARGADVYPNAISNASWTLPGHTSLFTGQPLHVHRTDLTPVAGFQPFLDLAVGQTQEALVLGGYRTSGITANEVVGYRTGLTRGFHRYRIPGRDWLTVAQPILVAQLLGLGRMPEITQLLVDLTDINRNGEAEEVTHYAIEEVDAALAAGDHPLYLFLNYMDVHRPYPGPPGTPLATRLTFWRDHFAVLTDQDLAPETIDRTVGKVKEYYYHAAARIDRAVGELFDHLREVGIFDEALIIVTADHGEAFHENPDLEDYFGHNGAYEPVVRIPFIVKWPGQREGQVIERTVQQTDVSSLVATATRVPGVPAGKGDDATLITEWYPRLSGHGGLLATKRRALYEGPIKYARTKDGEEQLFDLSLGRWETHVADVPPEVLEMLRARFDAVFTGDSDEESGKEMDRELRRQLEALGYIGN